MVMYRRMVKEIKHYVMFVMDETP